MEMKINLKRCFYELLKKTPVIIIVTVLTAIIGFVFALVTASESTYYGVSSVCSLVYGSYDETISGQDMLSAFSSISESSRVANRAAIILGDDNIDGEKIKSMINIMSSSETSAGVIDIYAYAQSPELAVKVSNAVADAFVIELKNITSLENVQVLDRAQTAKVYTDKSTQRVKIVLIFAVMGFLLACATVVLMTIFSSKVISLEECLLNDELNLIGVIPESKEIN